MVVKSRLVILFLFVIVSLFWKTPKVLAGCTTGAQAQNCASPFVSCSDSSGTLYCCGDGVSTTAGNQECATLNASNGNGSGVGTPGQLMGQFNHIIFGSSFNEGFYTPRGIISFLLPYLFTLAGLILFVMIIWGGFEMLTGAADPKSQEAGKQRLTAGIIGFLLIFSAYWLAQLLQTIFGISILK